MLSSGVFCLNNRTKKRLWLPSQRRFKFARVVILVLALDGFLQRLGGQAKAFRKLLNGIGHHDIAVLDQAFVEALDSLERHIGWCAVVEGEDARLACVREARCSFSAGAYRCCRKRGIGRRWFAPIPRRYDPATKSNGCAGSCREASRSCRSTLSFPKFEKILILGNYTSTFAAWHAS